MTEFIELGGEKRPFCVGMGALVEYEKMTGKSLLTGEELGLTAIGDFAYCCLFVGARARKLDRDFTPEDVVDWIDARGAFAEVSKLIGDGLGKFGKAATGEKEKIENPPSMPEIAM